MTSESGFDWARRVVVITGGSGTIGNALVPELLARGVRAIRVFSRDERKQEDMARRWPEEARILGGRLRFFIGDVRDAERLTLALRGADVVIHAAALKIVPSCAYNPSEAIATNVRGSLNVARACIECGVRRAVLLSTDKAVEPVTLYGASKALAEHVFTTANNLAGNLQPARLCCVRYGNVIGSRGSVLPLFIDQAAQGEITVTDANSTRFWISQAQAVALIFKAIDMTRGGEIFIPKAPTMRVLDLAKAVGNGAHIKEVGLRAQEKLHEVLVTHEEARRTKDAGDYYIVEPEGACWERLPFDFPHVPPGFRYASNGCQRWVSEDEFREQAHEYASNRGGGVNP